VVGDLRIGGKKNTPRENAVERGGSRSKRETLDSFSEWESEKHSSRAAQRETCILPLRPYSIEGAHKRVGVVQVEKGLVKTGSRAP